MNNSGDAAEQIVKMSIDGAEFAVRITGTALKETILLFIAALKNNNKEHLKLRGKERLKSMLKSGKPLEIYSIREKDLDRFVKGAKEYGIVYSVVKNAKDCPDGLCDIMVKADDAPKIARMAERFNFATVDRAKNVPDVTDNTSVEAEATQGSEQGAMDIAETEKLMDDLFGTDEGKAEPDTPEPEKVEVPQASQSKTETAKQEAEVKDSHPLATGETPNPNQSVPTSEQSKNSEKDSFSRPSVREELREIKASQKAKTEEIIKRDDRNRLDRKRRTYSTNHKQPQNSGKTKKPKSKGR